MNNSLLLKLKEQDVEFYGNYNLAKRSYIGIGSETALLLLPDSIEKLVYSIDILTEYGICHRIAGGMSNILPSDGRFCGAVIIADKIKDYFVAERSITAFCGVNLSKMIYDISKISLGGFSDLYGIPGTVGGAVYGNAGAFGTEMADVLLSAEVYLPNEKKKYILTASDMSFSHRSSVLKHTGAVLLSATMRAESMPQDRIRKLMSERIEYRRRTQPCGEQSLGSVFKRRDGIPISRLIDESGLKGLSVGGAMISKKHAGFIINSGGATAADVKALIAIIKRRLSEKYGIVPEEEIVIW